MSVRIITMALAVLPILSLVLVLGDEPAAKDRQKQSLERLLGYKKDVPVDLFIDHFVSLKEGVNEKAWSAALELAAGMSSKAAKATGRPVAGPDKVLQGDVLKNKSFIAGNLGEKELKPLGLDTMFGNPRVSIESLSSKGSIGGLVVCSGKMEFSGMPWAVVLSNGSVNMRGTIAESIVFCDGDLEGAGIIVRSLVIVTGSLECKILDNSVVLAGEDVKCGIATSSFMGTRGAVTADQIVRGSVSQAKMGSTADIVDGTSTIKQGGFDPLGVVSLFDPKQVGVQVGADVLKQRVIIESVEEGKPFAVAGLKKADQVLAFNGKEISRVEEFRRLLRRSLAGAGVAALRVNRSGKTIELKVELNR